MFRGSIEELINNLEIAIPESLKYLLELALNGAQAPAQSLPPKKSAPSRTPDLKTQSIHFCSVLSLN